MRSPWQSVLQRLAAQPYAETQQKIAAGKACVNHGLLAELHALETAQPPRWIDRVKALPREPVAPAHGPSG